ncbi:MAG: DUF4340 domain-containing protein [Planctomycetota bacterium]
MSFRTTGLLLLCVVVAGGLFWWSRSMGGPAPKPSDGPPLIPGKLLAVEVAFASRDYKVQRDGNGWSQTSPQYAPLQAEAGRAWVDAVAALRPLQEVQPGVADVPGLAELALAPPVANVTVITNGGAVELALGDQTLAGTGYLRLDDGRVLLVPDALHNLVYGPPPTSQLADVLPLPPLASLDLVTFTRGRDTVTLHRLPAGWSLRPDALERVRFEVLDGLRQLTDDTPILRHRDSADGATQDLARYGLQPPRASLTFAGPDRPTFTLEMGRSAAVEQGAMFARLSRDATPGPIVALPLERTKIAFAPLQQFRDPRLFEAAADQVTELRIASTGTPNAVDVTLRDTGAGLAYLDPGAMPDASADQLLAAVLALRSTGPIPGELALGEDPIPRFTIQLSCGVTRSVDVNLYRTPSGWFAQRSDELDPTDVTEATMRRLLVSLPGDATSP